MDKKVRLDDVRLNERQFTIAVKRLADSISFGSDQSPFVGTGMEYLQSRIYEPGDSIKSIDWRVTARTGKVHVKEYEVPKRVPTYILLDSSASMCISSHRISKYEWAVQLGTALALASQARMSPVGILACGDREFHVRPTLSRNQVLGWAHSFREYHYLEQTTLGRGLRLLAPSLFDRCLLIVLSDLHDPDAVPALKRTAQKHDIVVLQLHDPAEVGKVGGGIFRGREAETGESFIGHGGKRWFDEDDRAAELRRAGVDHLLLKTDEPFHPRLRGFLKSRGNAVGKG